VQYLKNKEEIEEFRQYLRDMLRSPMTESGMNYWGGALWACANILGETEKPEWFHEVEKAKKLNKEMRIQDM
jgi:hypothetical protein